MNLKYKKFIFLEINKLKISHYSIEAFPFGWGKDGLTGISFYIKPYLQGELENIRNEPNGVKIEV